MFKKSKVLVFLLIFLLAISSVSFAAPATLENVSRIHFDSIVVDTHNDTMMIP